MIVSLLILVFHSEKINIYIACVIERGFLITFTECNQIHLSHENFSHSSVTTLKSPEDNCALTINLGMTYFLNSRWANGPSAQIPEN